MSEVINFACTSCGACCETAPRFTFLDILNLSNEFIFQTRHYAVLSTAKDPLPRERIQHLEALAHTVLIEEASTTMFYWTSLGAMQKPSQKTCSKLKDKLCSIYDNRPINCRNMPAYIAFPASMQEKVISFYKNNSLYKCDFSEDAPEYYKNENFAQEYQETMFYNELDQTRVFTDRYLSYIGKAPGALDVHFKNALKATVKNTEMLTDIMAPLVVMVLESWASPEQIDEVLLNQISLIEKDIEYSRINKIKDDVKIARFYKDLLLVYNKALNNNLFHNLNGGPIIF